MLEKILQAVKEAMIPDLSQEQMEKLENVLYIQFHGKTVTEECTSLQPLGTDGDEAKIKMFLGSKRTTGRSENTLRQYSREIYNMLDFLGKRLEDITGMDLRYYYAVMRETRHIKMSTMRTRIHYLSSFWDFLTLEKLVPDNPVKRIGSLRLDSIIKKPFATDDIESLRLSCRNSRDRAMVEFLLATGLRVSELCKLNVGDLDMYRMEFFVVGKWKKERMCLFDETSKYYLRIYFQDRRKKERLSEEDLKRLPLFTSARSPYRRISIAGVQNILKSLARGAGVEDVHPHRFRRTFATNMLAGGMQIEQLKVLMGHSKVETTLIYALVKENSIKESYRRLKAS